MSQAMNEEKPRHRPSQDEAPDEPEQHRRMPPGRESRGVDHGIADADKCARVGKNEEPVRNTPPFGDWDDTSAE
jgi:hypothetical protein